jgi:hypothetical protein
MDGVPTPRPRRALAGLVLTLLLTPGAAPADWWEEHVQIHGFFTSNLYTRSPNMSLAQEARVSSWRNELNVEVGVDLYQGDELRIGGYGVFRPVYDAVYEVSPKQWGDSAQGGQIGRDSTGQQRLRFDLGASTAPDAITGKEFESFEPDWTTGVPPQVTLRSRCGAAVKNEFCLDNNDVGSAFSGDPEPSITIDDIVFFGVTSAPWKPNQGPIGGNATGDTYQDYLDSPFRQPLAFDRLASIVGPGLAGTLSAQGTASLQASLNLASQPLSTPLNFRRGALGDVDSLKQAPFDVNRTENELKFDCFDNAHPWCFVREAYLEVEWRDTLVRVGRQQVVWGKTDAFRLQDIAMPIDLGYHNIFPTLEERRIPQLALSLRPLPAAPVRPVRRALRLHPGLPGPRGRRRPPGLQLRARWSRRAALDVQEYGDRGAGRVPHPRALHLVLDLGVLRLPGPARGAVQEPLLDREPQPGGAALPPGPRRGIAGRDLRGPSQHGLGVGLRSLRRPDGPGQHSVHRERRTARRLEERRG